MKSLIGLFIVALLASCGGGKSTPASGDMVANDSVGLAIDMRLNVVAPDSDNYTTFMGPLGGVEQDFFDTTTGASAKQSTAAIANYMIDTEKATSMPYGVRSLFLFPVAENTRVADNFTARKAADGVITIMYAHRGVAYRMVTDAQGALIVPSASIEKRTIGTVDNVFSSVLASDTTAATLDWAKVWDNTVVAEGVEAITLDAPTSKIVIWGGELNFVLDDNILKVQGNLQPSRP